MKVKSIIFAGALILGGTITAAAEQNGTNIEIDNSWAKPNYGPNGAVYLTLTNIGKEIRQLISASSPISNRVELHEHKQQNGVMRMRRIKEGIVLKPGQKIIFKPAGRHIMLFGVKKKYQNGETFPLTLIFKNGESKTISIKVDGSNKKTDHSTHKHH